MFIYRRCQFVRLYDAGDKSDRMILTGRTASTGRNSSPIACFSNINPTLTSLVLKLGPQNGEIRIYPVCLFPT